MYMPEPVSVSGNPKAWCSYFSVLARGERVGEGEGGSLRLYGAQYAPFLTKVYNNFDAGMLPFGVRMVRWQSDFPACVGQATTNNKVHVVHM